MAVANFAVRPATFLGLALRRVGNSARHIAPGSVNSVGQYNHFSALRSYEDLLGIDQGGMQMPLI